MFAFGAFLLKVGSEGFIPMADILSGVVKGIPKISGTSFLHVGMTVI